MKATPEMIDAGAEVLSFHNVDLRDAYVSSSQVAEEVWDAMFSAMPKHAGGRPAKVGRPWDGICSKTEWYRRRKAKEEKA